MLKEFRGKRWSTGVLKSLIKCTDSKRSTESNVGSGWPRLV